jgi:hypothetical protein
MYLFAEVRRASASQRGICIRHTAHEDPFPSAPVTRYDPLLRPLARTAAARGMTSPGSRGLDVRQFPGHSPYHTHTDLALGLCMDGQEASDIT